MTASSREKFNALREVVTYNPVQFVLVIILSLATAVLEGVGLSFLLPIVDQASDGQLTGAPKQGLVGAFESVYSIIGLPFTLETLLVGAALAIGLRFATSLCMRYLRVQLVIDYVRDLKVEVFNEILTAELAYVDDRGSDTLLNILITQTNYPANVLSSVLSAVERSLLIVVYLALALAVEPILTGAAALVLIVITLGITSGIGPAYDAGDRVSEANEKMQSHAQSGIQGIRDVRLFGLRDDVSSRYEDAVNEYSDALVLLRVKRSLVSNVHQFTAVLAVLIMVYAALRWSAMSLGAVGVFLFAMLRLAPNVSSLQGDLYYIDGELPHLIETLREREELETCHSQQVGHKSVPESVESITFEDVRFNYSEEEYGITNTTLSAEQGEFTAIVGESGAGKSTIVSLLAQLYTPDSGKILVNEVPLTQIDGTSWREKIAVVRQDPYLFDDTLRANIGIGCSDLTKETFDIVCTAARIDAFVDDLPHGYNTQLGEDGVRLSGGQRQRVAIARALVRNPEVLILDEATSNLDAGLEHEILQAVQTIAHNCIVIVVTHQLESVADADQIYTIEDGQIVESGRHDELVNADGTYASLYEPKPVHRRYEADAPALEVGEEADTR